MNEHKLGKAVIGLANGDREALSLIYDQMSRLIFSIAYAITGNYHDAEDVLQDTLIKIVKNAHMYEEKDSAKAWVLKMVRNIAVDAVRKRKEVISLDGESDKPDFKSEDAGFSNVEALDLLKNLDDEERQVILLRLYSKTPYREISKIIGISESAAQKKYQRALIKLKSFL